MGPWIEVDLCTPCGPLDRGIPETGLNSPLIIIPFRSELSFCGIPDSVPAYTVLDILDFRREVTSHLGKE